MLSSLNVTRTIKACKLNIQIAVPLQLAGRLLYQLYSETHARVEEAIEQAEYITLTQDGWAKSQVG